MSTTPCDCCKKEPATHDIYCEGCWLDYQRMIASEESSYGLCNCCSGHIEVDGRCDCPEVIEDDEPDDDSPGPYFHFFKRT